MPSVRQVLPGLVASWGYHATGLSSPLGTVGPQAVGSGTTPAGRVFTVGRPGQVQPNPDGDPRIDLYIMELGNRTYTQSVNTLRLVAGLDGTLPDALGPLRGWPWELSFNHGRMEATDLTQGYTRISALRNALGPSKDGACYASYDPADATGNCGGNSGRFSYARLLHRM